MPDYTNTSSHAQSLASGRTLGPGESAPVSDDPHDRALIDSGALAPTETQTDYTTLPAAQLHGLADAAGLEVKGTGKDGNVIAADLQKALTANDKKTKE